MIIDCWIIIIVVAIIGIIASIIAFSGNKQSGLVISGISIILLTLTIVGCKWFMSTGMGQRALTDQKSNLHNGIERTVNVYTANGDLIAQYEGKIDIDTNDGGYVKFDFEGKRYIYYNCFIETIAEIED